MPPAESSLTQPESVGVGRKAGALLLAYHLARRNPYGRGQNREGNQWGLDMETRREDIVPGSF